MFIGLKLNGSGVTYVLLSIVPMIDTFVLVVVVVLVANLSLLTKIIEINNITMIPIIIFVFFSFYYTLFFLQVFALKDFEHPLRCVRSCLQSE